MDQDSLSAEEPEMMEDLLNRVRGNVQIPEEEVIQVARSFDKEMLRLLLDLKSHTRRRCFPDIV